MSTDETREHQPTDDAHDEIAASEGDARLDQVIAEYLRAIREGSQPNPQPWLDRYPELASELAEFFADHERVERIASPVRAAVTGLPPNSRLRYIGDYEVLDELGRGGMGVVYRARQVSLKRHVALKMILAGEHASAADLARFRAEAEAIAQLQHPHIVQIYEIGEYEGHPYAALELVEGGNLAQRLTGTPLPVRDAAQLVEVLGRAVHAAHERGIVHRDLKPANVLLQTGVGKLGAGASQSSNLPLPMSNLQPKITDFGLAKVIGDDNGHTRTGAIVGTPSYMAPEQAAGQSEMVGPAADIYALGAILYELITGRPPFRAETPLDTIRQVLENDPAAPKSLNSNVPRDLETICLKCLRKDVYDRYESSDELADDLQRFLNGEPIEARPVSMLEKAGRWLSKRRMPAALVAGTALAVMAIVIGAIRGLETHRESLLTSIRFQTKGPALTAEILSLDRDERIVPSFTVPTQEPLRLPAGEFRLRLSAPQQVSQEYQVLVERGNDRNWEVALADRSLWPSIEIGPNERFHLAEFEPSGTPDWIIFNRERLRRVRGTTGEVVWEATGDLPGKNSGYSWGHLLQVFDGESSIDLRTPAPDFNGDGVGDVVVGSSQRPVLVALSGATGEFLWTWSVEPAPRHITGPAAALETYDVNDDGTPDVLAIISAGGHAQIDEGGSFLGTHAVAISGRDGELLWRGRADSAGAIGLLRDKPHVSDLIETSEGPVLVLRLNKVMRWNARTGEPIGEATDFSEIETLADLDGDGQVDTGLKRTPDFVKGISLETGEEALNKRYAEDFETSRVMYRSDDLLPRWIDFDSDGAPELLAIVNLVPSGMTLRAVDIRTGDRLWQRKMPVEHFNNAEHQVNLRMIAGPDIDGDGWRELFMASITMESPRSPVTHHLFVDVVSGKTGELLWSWNKRLRGWLNDVSLGELAWAWRGPSGWPTLAVPHRYGPSSIFPSQTYLIDVGSGQQHETLTNVHEVYPTDFDGDGLTDLYWYEPLVENNPTWGGQLRCLRGELPAWRRLEPWQPAPDFDGDGLADLLTAGGGRSAAVSGDKGRLAWLSPVQGEKFVAATAPPGDFSGEGVADVVSLRQAHRNAPYPLSALSGSDGSLLWTSDEPRATGETNIRPGPLLELEDLDGDGASEVVAVMIHDGSDSSSHLELFVYAGRSGEVRWRRPLDLTYGRGLQVEYLDLTGDGIKDILLPMDTMDATLLAIDGRSGETLWQWSSPGLSWNQSATRPSRQVIPLADFTGDGQPAMLVNAEEVFALDSDGKQLWSWQFQRDPAQGIASQSPRGQVETALVRRSSPRRFGVYIFYNVDTWRQGADNQLKTHIVECNALGEVVQQAFFPPHTKLACHDLDNNGYDATLILTETDLLVFDDRLDGPPRWKWSRPEGRAEIIDVLTSSEAEESTVVVGIDQTAYGLIDGEIRWRADVAKPITGRLRRSVRLDAPTLLPAIGEKLPSFFVSYWPGSLLPGQGVVCRQAALTSPDGKYLPPVGEPQPFVPIRDPRQFRPLPWSDFAPATLGLVLAAMALAAVANFLAFRWGRHPPLSGLMLVLITVVAFALTGMFSPALVPAVVFMFLLIRYAVQRRLQAVVLLALAAIVLSGFIAAATGLIMQQGMLPGQQIHWQGWYAVLYFGIYATGLAALPVLLVLWLVRRSADQRRRRDAFRERSRRFEYVK